FFQAEDGIRDPLVTGVQTCALPIFPGVNSEYQRTLGDRWSGNAKIMRPVTDGKYGASTLYAEFAEGEAAPVVELTSRFRTQNRRSEERRVGKECRARRGRGADMRRA